MTANHLYLQPTARVIQALTEQFLIERPQFDPATGLARFRYGLDGRSFNETLGLPAGADATAAQSPAFRKLLDLTAVVLGVSYFKLKAPFEIAAPEIALTEAERAFAIDVYENGLGEFYARNNLMRFGKLTIKAPEDSAAARPAVTSHQLMRRLRARKIAAAMPSGTTASRGPRDCVMISVATPATGPCR